MPISMRSSAGRATCKVGQLLLTHLDNSMDYKALVAELPDWAAPAFDGQEVVLA